MPFPHILQNPVSRSPRMKESGMGDLFPFLSTADSLHPESLAFSTVCFSQELKFGSTFRKHEFHEQGLFWPSVRPSGHTSAWVSTGVCGPHVLAFGSHFSFVALGVCPPHSPLAVYPLLWYPFPTDRFCTGLFSPDPFETCSRAGLERGGRGCCDTGGVIGNQGEETLFLE